MGEKQGHEIDKDLEILKIQIYSERIHARYSTTISTSFALFIGFTVIFYTLLYENVLSALSASFGMLILTAGTVLEIYRVRVGLDRELARISRMIQVVRDGKELPKLEELRSRTELSA